uniref:Uncharacterized protein n=1 Tax=Kalanchoe fedtschenkoi TaxID=63787 RepID=A0A7N0VD70_KALFE
MSHMVMIHGLPFKFAEYVVFNMLMKESYPESRKVSQTTLKNDYITSYNNEKKRLIALLNSIECMIINCHFACEWKLHKRVLSFCHISPPHNGVAICEALHYYLNDWNLTNKLATVTADNVMMLLLGN